jgi:Transglycosylase SLT domain/Peptidase family M23
MIVRPPSIGLLALIALMLAVPASVGAQEAATTAPTATTTTPAPVEATAAPGSSSITSTESPAAGATTGEPGASTGAETAPQVQAQHLQRVTRGRPAGRRAGHVNGRGKGSSVAGEQPSSGSSRSVGQPRASHLAPRPSTLTPSLPFSLRESIAGVPWFFIESFQIPPFLLPIYQAAGTAYGVPWPVLAAINEVETDYGRDLSVSSAGAEGWMQFLPSTWARYGVDATGAGYEDPYNPADAIFAAARYLRAAGGSRHIRAAVYAYNHSQAYVDTVMLRAQLLGGTPPQLLGALTGLTESRFPVHAPAHFSDGFQTVPAHGSIPSKTLAATAIYAPAGAPVIAVQDGEIVQVGESPSLGRFVSLRDGYGNTYVYAELGSVAPVYPVLQPRQHTAVSARIAPAGRTGDSNAEQAPSGPATAGAQPRSALSEGATVSGFALGAAAGLEPAPASSAPGPAHAQSGAPPHSNGARQFAAGPNEVYLHALTPGVRVLAGTVLGHVGTDTGSAEAQPGEPHMLFQIKPAGAGAPLIDPKPILDGWVALESTSIFRAKGENPFLATSPTVGQVLLEPESQLQRQVARDPSIHMRSCARGSVQAGHVAKPVLAMLEYLSVSGLKPTVGGLKCAGAAAASEGNPSLRASGSVRILAVNGTPIAGHQGPGSIADTTIRKLLMLQGLNRPRRIVSTTSIPGAGDVFVKPNAGGYIRVTFAPPKEGLAHAASAATETLTPAEWVKLIARLGEIPDPTVSVGPSTAAIPDNPGASGSPGSGRGPGEPPATSGSATQNGNEGGAGGNG